MGGGGGGDFWSASFSRLNALQDIFFSLLISLQLFFFLKKVSCLHLQNVFTFTLWLLQ